MDWPRLNDGLEELPFDRRFDTRFSSVGLVLSIILSMVNLLRS